MRTPKPGISGDSKEDSSAMTTPSLYLKLTHISSAPKQNPAFPTQPPVPYNTTLLGPRTGPIPALVVMGLLQANTTSVEEPVSAYNTTTPAGPLTAQNDHYGAMLFTVATVCVYGLSIVFFIAGHTQKRELNKDEENQISSYLKRLHLEEPSKEDRLFHVIRLKSQFLAASALGQRHNRRVSLLPRPIEHFFRPDRDRADDDRGSQSSGDEDLDEDGSSSDRSLLNPECSLQHVDEEPRSSSAVSPPFRGRRFACVGFGNAVGRSDDGPGIGRTGSQRRPRATLRGLPSIEEDEVPMQALGALVSAHWRGSSQSLSADEDDPSQSSPPGPEQGDPQALSGSRSVSVPEQILQPAGCQDTLGSPEQQLDDGSVMVTRL